MAARIDALLKLLQQGQDAALLRFAIGNEYLRAKQPGAAIEHLQAATTQDAGYSAAWKLLGKALAATGRNNDARAAFESGIAAAMKKGDRQAAKEMTVFLKRLPPDGAEK